MSFLAEVSGGEIIKCGTEEKTNDSSIYSSRSVLLTQNYKNEDFFCMVIETDVGRVLLIWYPC